MKHSTTCAHCGTDIIDIDTEITNYHAHSMVIVVQKITPEGYTFYQCDGGQRVHRHNYNYWHCSKEHMKSAMPTHIKNHVVENRFQAPPPGNTVNLHQVLEDNLMCAVCGVALVSEAYRLYITYATPIAFIPDGMNSADEHGWCCTLEHAKEHAISLLATI